MGAEDGHDGVLVELLGPHHGSSALTIARIHRATIFEQYQHRRGTTCLRSQVKGGGTA